LEDFQERELDSFLLLHLSIEDSKLNKTPFITKEKKIIHLLNKLTIMMSFNCFGCVKLIDSGRVENEQGVQYHTICVLYITNSENLRQ